MEDAEYTYVFPHIVEDSARFYFFLLQSCQNRLTVAGAGCRKNSLIHVGRPLEAVVPNFLARTAYLG